MLQSDRKECIKCKETKPVSEFYFRQDTKKYFGSCKKCCYVICKKYRKEYPEKTRINSRNRYAKDPIRGLNYILKYNAKYPERVRESRCKSSAKLRSNPDGKLKACLSSLICNSLKKGVKARNKWQDIVGYSAEQLKEHLEKQFISGMNWENYGKWHIDHIIPKSFFKFSSFEDVEFKMCWRLENLQPLWATDNKKKHTKLLRVA